MTDRQNTHDAREGWVLVPKKPTLEMCRAVQEEMRFCNPVDIYQKMLAALACRSASSGEAAPMADVELLQAEIEALRKEREVWKASFEQAAAGHATYAERAERLAKVLRLAEEHIGALTPEWYSAGQRVLAEIRDVLEQEERK